MTQDLVKRVEVLETKCHRQSSPRDLFFYRMITLNAFILVNIVASVHVSTWWVLAVADVPAVFGFLLLFLPEKKK